MGLYGGASGSMSHTRDRPWSHTHTHTPTHTHPHTHTHNPAKQPSRLPGRSSACDGEQTRPPSHGGEKRIRAGELRGGKGGGREEKTEECFQLDRERERQREREGERLKVCSGICFHFRKVLWLMCISWLLASAYLCVREREAESEGVRQRVREKIKGGEECNER